VRITKTFGFEAAHRLLDYQGKCERLHGHSYKLAVTVDAPVRPDGIAFDFTDLKRIVAERVVDALDHRYLNDYVPKSTAEHVVVWIWERLKDLPLDEITLWETASSSVTYRGEAHRKRPRARR
jgi:6-pyruvoyltetrahydropterin/6-carboxytetrahydropterin synthase